MTKKKGLIIGAAVAVVLAAVVLILVFIPKGGQQNEKNGTLDEGVDLSVSVDKDGVHQAKVNTDENGNIKNNSYGTLMEYYPANISHMHVENTKGTFDVLAETPEGEATIYTIKGYEDFDLQGGNPAMIASAAAKLSFTKVATLDREKGNSEFGFDKPRATVTVTYLDNTKAIITVGDDAPQQAGTYIRFGTGDAVYVADTEAVAAFDYGITDLISKTVNLPADSADNNEASSVTLSGSGFSDEIVMVPSDDANYDASYALTAPVSRLADEKESSLLSQQILTTENKPVEIHKIYSQGQLLGVLNDEKKLKDFLNAVYVENYQESFPDSSVSLGKDVYVSDEISYFTYEDIDDQIMDYLKQNGLFTIRAVSVEFSDTNGIYAESRSTGISISQTITVQEAYASPGEVMQTVDEVLEYLEYGGNTEKQYYTVQKYDTVAGVGAKNYGLSATQVMNINRDKISSVDQVLSEGEVLCVTYFNSPIDIVVTRESMRKEIIYPQTVYAENPELRKGVSQLRQSGVNGSKNSLYSERWINGVLMSGTLISSVDTLQPVNEIIDVGTMEIPGYGTGTFRWPVDNPVISCGWGCYWGHRAIDVQNSYNHWDKISTTAI